MGRDYRHNRDHVHHIKHLRDHERHSAFVVYQCQGIYGSSAVPVRIRAYGIHAELFRGIMGRLYPGLFKLSLMTGDVFQDSWAKSWPIFYWCNWLAWTPITAVFLGKILRGYTIKDAIKCNFVIPATFQYYLDGTFCDGFHLL